MGEEYQRQSVPPGQPGRFRVAAQDNELLPQQGIFGQQFSSAAREVGQRAHHQVRTDWLGEAAKELAGGG